jgi:hypothetical protein
VQALEGQGQWDGQGLDDGVPRILGHGDDGAQQTLGSRAALASVQNVPLLTFHHGFRRTLEAQGAEPEVVFDDGLEHVGLDAARGKFAASDVTSSSAPKPAHPHSPGHIGSPAVHPEADAAGSLVG